MDSTFLTNERRGILVYLLTLLFTASFISMWRFEPPWHKKLPVLKGRDLNEIERIMNDKTWTKAIFLRDPSRRPLSSYLYLIKNKEQTGHYRDALRKATNNRSLEWPHFVNAVVDLKHQNLHWRPQVLPLYPFNCHFFFFQQWMNRATFVRFTSFTPSTPSSGVSSSLLSTVRHFSRNWVCGKTSGLEGGPSPLWSKPPSVPSPEEVPTSPRSKSTLRWNTYQDSCAFEISSLIINVLFL